MNHKGKSIRPFIGAKDFEVSRSFYRDLGFVENLYAPDFAVFHSGSLTFYLQAYYVKDWVENTMVFMEVEDVNRFYADLTALNLTEKYEGVHIVPIRTMDWGRECFVHDPSGILWHFGEFF
ncbi:VOC family protein [uncultured Flavobacterium sp.]|uniref:VOC family protein n=1 Tax=uncultured Flavobacterium sp. TaxID=165435 RepID=UPI0025FA10D4|nr:VOC family protein [uncultured Flavobacterium sp.]